MQLGAGIDLQSGRFGYQTKVDDGFSGGRANALREWLAGFSSADGDAPTPRERFPGRAMPYCRGIVALATAAG
ncbi:MAG: hypothetical protein CBB71_15990 [Rhodopirellula sp. TMED11]|nr:MAG: hypothetical protein CBB71_15990 [Rhodopirellula sp. TMED11]